MLWIVHTSPDAVNYRESVSCRTSPDVDHVVVQNYKVFNGVVKFKERSGCKDATAIVKRTLGPIQTKSNLDVRDFGPKWNFKVKFS